MLQFVTNNYDVAFKAQIVGEDDDNMNVLGGIRRGVLVGVYDHTDDIVYTATFLDHGHFFPDQVKMKDQMDFERLLGSLSLGQRKALLERREAREGGASS